MMKNLSQLIWSSLRNSNSESSIRIIANVEHSIHFLSFAFNGNGFYNYHQTDITFAIGVLRVINDHNSIFCTKIPLSSLQSDSSTSIIFFVRNSFCLTEANGSDIRFSSDRQVSAVRDRSLMNRTAGPLVRAGDCIQLVHSSVPREWIEKLPRVWE